jgi:4-carboxymuconolactone decarboxylase
MGFVAGSVDPTLHLYEVHFDGGARTRWHSHSGEQVLLCLSGTCVVQLRGERPRILVEREAVRIRAGVVHWHGALKEPASHLAVNIATSTTWLDEVSMADFETALAEAGI